jgi:hypothetical protein
VETPRSSVPLGEGMLEAPVLRGKEALRLAAIATPEARSVLRRFAPEQVAAALQELSASDQVAFLEVADRLPEIVPCLPEIALTQTIRHVGLEDAGWLVEFASPEQRIAALDLDCWQDRRLSPSRVFEWIDALIEAGMETLLAALDELDPELWILALQWMAKFSIPGRADEDPDDDADSAASDASTDDGIVFYCSSSPDHEERIRAILGTARIYSPSLYWDLVYGAINEPSRSCEEMIARLGQAISELPPERANEIQSQLFSLANAIAVADRLPLADAEALEHSVRKALEGVDRGLAALASAHFRSLGEIADTTPARDLFRIGATLHPELRPQSTLAELEEKEDAGVGFDWDVVDKWLSEEDQTLAPDGTLREGWASGSR